MAPNKNIQCKQNKKYRKSNTIEQQKKTNDISNYRDSLQMIVYNFCFFFLRGRFSKKFKLPKNDNNFRNDKLHQTNQNIDYINGSIETTGTTKKTKKQIFVFR